MSVDLTAQAEIGKSYRVVARLESDGIGYELRGTLRSKTMKLKGERHWHFEGPVWEHFVRPDYIDEIEPERRTEIF